MHSCTLGVCRVTCNRLCRYVSRMRELSQIFSFPYKKYKKKKRKRADHFLDATLSLFRVEEKKEISNVKVQLLAREKRGTSKCNIPRR